MVSRIGNEYFEWMYDMVCDHRDLTSVSYRNLLIELHNTEFYPIFEEDDRREKDGTDLRYRFLFENGYSAHEEMDLGRCSILELMIALSIRCEEQIMSDPKQGNRTGQWFWNMVVSLGLSGMSDDKFDEEKVHYILERFVNREYDANGHGGLFAIDDCTYDMRNEEIWVQMCLYLNEYLSY